MTATSGAGIDRDSRTILRRYYLAMAVPFGIDLMTSAVYAGINDHPLSLLPLTAILNRPPLPFQAVRKRGR